MIVIQPVTSSQSFAIRVRETSSVSPISYKIKLVSEDTNVSSSIIPTASFNSNDFLTVTASFNLTNDGFYYMQLFQMSGSTEIQELYSGEMLYSSASAYTASTPDFITYTGSNNEYIIY